MLSFIKPTNVFIPGYRQIGARYQSSSSPSKLVAKDDEEEKIQQRLHNKQSKQQSKSLPHKEVDSTKSQTKSIEKTVSKKGFSNVMKVPSTFNLDTKTILLDKLYQGYNPLLSPITPSEPKKKKPSIFINIYEDLASLDDIYNENDILSTEEDDKIDKLMGPKLQISKFIFDKDPKVESKLSELKLNVDGKDGAQTDNEINSKIIQDLFQTREKFIGTNTKNSSQGVKRGRYRLNYKKNAASMISEAQTKTTKQGRKKGTLTKKVKAENRE